MGLQHTEAKQQALQELKDARDQLGLQSQLVREQDEEVAKLQRLLAVEHEQMAAQELQHTHDVGQLQECIRKQQEQAAVQQHTAAVQDAQGMLCDVHKLRCRSFMPSCLV